jgi:uncharacterized protein (DUF4415 family)
LRELDAHVVLPEKYEDAPELTDAQLANATDYVGVRLPGRPKAEVKKQATSLRVNADVLKARQREPDGRRE